MNKKFFKDCLLIIVFCIALCICLIKIDSIFAFLNGMISLLSPVFIGILLALLLNTPYRFLYGKFRKIKPPAFIERIFRKKKGATDEKSGRKGGNFAKASALILSYLIFFAIVVLVVAFVVPQITSSVLHITDNAESYGQQLVSYIYFIRDELFISEKTGETTLPSFIANLDWDKITESFNELLSDLMKYAGDLTSQLINFTTNVVSGVTSFVMGLIFSIYFVLGKNKIREGAKNFSNAFIPKRINDALTRGGRLAGDVLASYLVKQVLDGLIVGLLCFTGISITGFEYPVLIAVILGLFCMVPVFGPVVGCIVSLLLILLIRPSSAFLYLLFFIAILALTYKVFMPKLRKRTFSIHPLLVLFAAVAGGYAFGFWGIFFSVPCMTVVSVLVTEAIKSRDAESDVVAVKTVSQPSEKAE